MSEKKYEKHDSINIKKQFNYYDNINHHKYEDEDEDEDENHLQIKEKRGIEDILFKLPQVPDPLIGTPKEVQEELDKMVLRIQKDPDAFESEMLYNKIFLYMHGYLVNVALKQFPYIQGMQTNDIFQQALIALWYKAIPNFRMGKGMSFLNFAKMCIRRHLITLLNASKNRQKDQSINRAVSIDKPIDDESKNTFLSILSDDSNAADVITEQQEVITITINNLKKTLSEFESMVLDGYLTGGSYKEIASSISLQADKKCAIKAVDNALLRIRQKAIQLKIEQYNEDNDLDNSLPLFL